MYLFTIVFTIDVLPRFLTIVNVIVKVFIVFYDVFLVNSLFHYSLFCFFGLEGSVHPGTQAAETLVPQSITLRGSRYTLGARTDV